MADLKFGFTKTSAPVQAKGTVEGFPFYFRARHEFWTFAVYTDPKHHPAEIASEAERFFLEGAYGIGTFDASYMPLEEAERIMHECSRLYSERVPAANLFVSSENEPKFSDTSHHHHLPHCGMRAPIARDSTNNFI